MHITLCLSWSRIIVWIITNVKQSLLLKITYYNILIFWRWVFLFKILIFRNLCILFRKQRLQVRTRYNHCCTASLIQAVRDFRRIERKWGGEEVRIWSSFLWGPIWYFATIIFVYVRFIYAKRVKLHFYIMRWQYKYSVCFPLIFAINS
jgi:hypothetical protein